MAGQESVLCNSMGNNKSFSVGFWKLQRSAPGVWVSVGFLWFMLLYFHGKGSGCEGFFVVFRLLYGHGKVLGAKGFVWCSGAVRL